MMRPKAVTAVTLLCLSLVVLDLQGVGGRKVPTRVLYADLPPCHGSEDEIPGVTYTVVPLSHTVDDECTPKRGYIPPVHCQDPPVTAAQTKEDDECTPRSGYIPPTHCQDPPVTAPRTEADDECTPSRGYIPPIHCQNPPFTFKPAGRDYEDPVPRLETVLLVQ